MEFYNSELIQKIINIKMAKNINHLQHLKSSVVIETNGVKSPKLPAPSALVEGEIAINYAKGYESMSIKNSSGDVVTFSSDDYYSKQKLGSAFTGANSAVTVTEYVQENEYAVSTALNNLENNKLDASAFTEYWVSGTGQNSVVLKGSNSTASGDLSVAEGGSTTASGNQSHAEGVSTDAIGTASHAEGSFTTASGQTSHAEGSGSKAYANNSHAEGESTTANGQASHAEGYNTETSGACSHAEGNNTKSNGLFSHAEGYGSISNGQSSHAEGYSTVANNDYEHASGIFNVSHSATTTFGDSGNTLFSVGNGSDSASRHNAFEIRQNGDIYFVNKNGNDVKLQDEIGNIIVDQAITPETSASTNAVATKVVAEIESVMAASLNDLNDNKVDKVSGKGLSTNDYTTEEKTKLSGIAAGAEVNVQANWTETAATADSYIQNKPTLGTAAAKGVSNGITNSDNLIEAKHIYSGVGVTIEYDSNTQYINLKNTAGNVLSSFNASGFVVDGMIETVSAGTSGDTTVLDIKWNTAAGSKETILDIGDIFEADNYFTKQQLSGTTGYVTVTKANSANTASTVALTGVTGADDLKAIEALAGTSGYLKKTAANTWTLDNNTYSSATEISEALGTGFTVSSVTEVFEENERVWSIALATLDEDKTDVSAFTAHTASTSVHLNSTEKTNLDALATNIGAISGISSSDITNWNSKTSNTGTVTKVSTASGLTGGDITTSGTIGLAATGTAGTYGPSADVTGTEGSTIVIPQITTDAYGRVTSVTERTLTNKNSTYTVNDGTLSLQANGTTKTSFTANQSGNATFNITSGSTNGTISVGGTDVPVKGLGTMAYENASSYSSSTEIDEKLGSGFTGANSGNTVTSVIEQNEFAVSQSLNNLNDAITGHTSDTAIHNRVSVSGTTLYIL